MKTRIFRGAEVLGEFDLEPGEYVIGSGESSDVRLEDPSVAPQHTRLKVGTGGVEVEDLGSEGGTLLGDLTLSGVQPIFDGALIHIGDLTLQFSTGEAPAPSPEAEPDSTDGRYVIGEVVAQGAMGVIRRAREITTGREVAMKQMHDRLALADPGLSARFAQEARITAHLEHPNVVPVHDVSAKRGGERFYTMKMVRGISLEEVLNALKEGTGEVNRKYSLENLLTIFQKVCDALAFAHSKGVIHRDLKPANIMVGEYGEVLVMDWGVAKVLGEKEDGLAVRLEPAPDDRRDSFATMAGTVMGTPYYMAPEQANGDIEFLDERSDVYALGAILYELLTLHPPVQGRNAREVLEQARLGKIIPVTERTGKKPIPHLPGGRVPASLAAVIMKALSRLPDQRYARVVDFQAEIRAYQSGRATGAEGASAWRQMTLLVKRNKGVATAIAASLLLIVALSALYTVGVIRERDRTAAALAQVEPERQRANAERDRATAALALVEPEKQRANAERDKATAALALVEPERQRANLERDRAEEESKAAKIERDRAQATLAQLRSTAPTFIALAREFAEQAKTEEALEKIGFALSLDPSDPSFLRLKADVLQTAQRLKEAAVVYRQSLALQPDARAQQNLALCEALLRENGPAPQLTAAVRGKLQQALAQQGRANDALIVSRQTSTDVRANIASLGLRKTRTGRDRLTPLPDGTFGLDLSFNELTTIPPLQSFPISHLDVSDNPGLTDLTPLRGLKLKDLRMVNTFVSDLSPLKGMPLETLLISSRALKDISPILGLPIQRLFLIGAQFPDFKVLQKIGTLEMLSLKGSNCADLSALRGMKLKALDISDIRVTDLSALTGMPLTDLILDPTNITDPTPLYSIPLKNLAFTTSPENLFQWIKNISACPHLETLAFSASIVAVTLHQPLKAMPKLTRIGVLRPELFDWKNGRENAPTFQDVGPADEFFATVGIDDKALEMKNQISAILTPPGQTQSGAIVSVFRGTASISLMKSDLTDLSLLSPFKIANFGRSKNANSSPLAASDLTPLKNWTALKYLDLSGAANVKDFAPLAKCGSLGSLVLDDTKITDLSVLRGLHLVLLSLANTGVADLSPLKGMPISNLNLIGTKVTDVSPLLECPNLQYLAIPSGVRNLELLRKSNLKYLSERLDSRGTLPAQAAPEFWAEYDARKN